MKAAVAYLKIALGVLQNNEPINRREGNTVQAELEKRDAEEIKKAISLIENHKG